MNNVTMLVNKMTIKIRSDGRYEGRLTVNDRRKSFYGKTKAEVKANAKEYLMKVENGYKESEKILLNDYIEYWLKKYKYSRIEPSSYTRLYRVYECQIKPTIGKRYIGDIKTKDVQNLIDEHANPSNKNVKPLAKSGLKKIIQLLRPCLEKAVTEGIIQENPCTDVILPTESYIKTQTKQQITLSDDEIAEFKKCALQKYKTSNEYRSRDAFILLIILNLGLRVGEALALEWDDINFQEKLVYIKKTVQSNIVDFNGDDRKIYDRVKDSTKTKSGERVLKINDTTMYYITELMEYDKRKGISSPYVACTNVGTRNNARNLQRSLNRIINKSTLLHDMTLHTLRHTFGSTLIRRGIGIEVVSKLMGHANITITYLKYIHVLQEQQAKAMDMISIS